MLSSTTPSRTGKPVRFIADEMLGRLAKWLRLLGQDVEYSSHIEDSTLLRHCMSDPPRRLLTRDKLLMARRPVVRGEIQALLVLEDNIGEQIRQVLEWSGARPLAPRCTICNGVLEAKPKVEVQQDVPPYVFRTQERFERCSSCGRIYWRATHWNRIQQVLDEVSPKAS